MMPQLFRKKAGLRDFIAVDLGREFLSAARVLIKGGRVVIGGSVSTDVPADVDPSDEEWLGRWLSTTFNEHRLGKAPLVFVVPRHLVGMKRFSLPSVEADELPDMVRIELEGQLPFSVDESVIDFAVLKQGDGRSEVVAAAIRTATLERFRKIAEAAGYRLARVTVRAFGTAAILDDPARPTSGAVLGLDLRAFGEVELVVSHEGMLRFARGAELLSLTEDVDHEEEARQLATEAKRSWMSYRLNDNAPDVTRVMVMGAHSVAEGVAMEVRQSLDRPAEVFAGHAAVTGAVEDLGSGWSLAGLGVEYVQGRDVLNFVTPKMPPDLAARRRVRILGAFAAVFFALLAAWQLSHVHLGRLEAQKSALEAEWNDLEPKVQRLQRREAQLEHIEQWGRTQVRWLDHLEYLTQRLPGPEQVLLGSLVFNNGRPRIEATTRGGKVSWSVQQDAAIVFSGAAVNREIADSLRLLLVSDPVYRTQPVGSDSVSADDRYRESFSLRLTIVDPTPLGEAEASSEDAEESSRAGFQDPPEPPTGEGAGG